MASDAPTNTTASDLSTECWSCKPLQQYVDLSKNFADTLSNTLHEPMLILFASLCGLWIVVSGIRLALRMTDINGVIKDFVFVSITGVLLGSQATGLISYVYSSAIDLMGTSSAAVFSVAGAPQSTGQETGLVALAANGEQAVAKVFQAAETVANAGALYKPQYYVYAFLLVLPYFLLVVAYSSQVVVAIFRAVMVGIFAPFLFMAFAFNWGRGMAMAGAKTLLASVLVLFACTAALSLCIYGVSAMNLDPTELSGDAAVKFASVTNTKFLVILFLGWAGTALMAEGTSIANSIAQTALTNAAAGIMTAGVSASAMLAGRKGGQVAQLLSGPAGEAASAASKGFFWGQNAMSDPASAGQAIAEKFRNINKNINDLPRW